MNPPMSAGSFSAGSGATNNTTQIAVSNGFGNTAAMLLAHVSGSGAIEWIYAPSVANAASTPFLTVNFGASNDYWITTAWVPSNSYSPFISVNNSSFSLWKECGIQAGEANQQITLHLSPDLLSIPLTSACTASVTNYNSSLSADTVNLQIVNNLADNLSVFLYYIDNKVLSPIVYATNGMALNGSSPTLSTLFGTGAFSEEFWLIQAVDTTNQVAYVTGGTGFYTMMLHDSDAGGTVTLTLTTDGVNVSKPSGNASLSFSSQSVWSIQTS